MRKKVCILILLFILTSTYVFFSFEVFADVQNVASDSITKISAWSFQESFDDSEKKELAKASNAGGTLIAMNTNDWISYNVNAENEGIYALTMAIGNDENNEASQKFDISLDGDLVHQIEAYGGNGWNSPTETYVGVITLPKGESTLKFTASSASLYFFYFKLERLTSSDLGDVRLSDNRGIYGEVGHITFSENSLSKFDILAPSDGYYKIVFTAKAETDSTLNISASGMTKGMVNIQGEDFYEAGFYCNLEAEDTLLEVAGLKGNVDFYKINLIKLSDDAEVILNEFSDDVKNASRDDEIIDAIEKAKDVLHPDGIYPENAIFSMSPVYSSLLNKGFRSTQEVVDAYFESVGDEKNNPKIKLYNGEKEIKKLESGKLSIVIDSSALSIKTAVAAVYEDNRLKHIGMFTENDEGVLKADLGDISLSEEKSYKSKIFFFKNIESISPSDTKVYREFFVDTFGSDITGDGSETAPFATIKKAKEAVKEISEQMTGDIIVNIKEGEYFLSETEVFDETHGGKNDFNVIYRGIGKTKPEIVGGERVDGWSEYADGIYCAPYELDNELRNLYVNGYSRPRARSEILYEVREYYDDSETDEEIDGFVIYPYMFPENISSPDSLELVFNTWWVSHRLAVDDIIRDVDEVIFVTNPAYYSATEQNTTSINWGKTFYIENALELLDEPGEFYYSKKDKMLYYYLLPEESIENIEVYVPKTEGLINICGSENALVENLYFENLDIKYGAWNDVTEHGIMFVQADKISNKVNLPNLVPGQFEVNYANNILIENCSFSCLGSAAIAFSDGVHNARINGNLIRDICGSGIIIGTNEHDNDNQDDKRCKNISVTNNVITRIAQEYMGCVGISAYYEKGIEILNNFIKETPYSGIHVGWGWLEGLRYDFGYYNISNNRVEDVMCVLDDGAHIYTLGQMSGSIISNNYLKTSGADYGGIYNDTGSGELNIYKNVIEDVSHSRSLWDRNADINEYSNYATVDLTRVDGGSFSGVCDISVYDIDNKPDEVVSIIENAGISSKYSSLSEQAELPKSEINLIKNVPTNRISWKEYYVPVWSKKEALIDATHYITTYHSDGYQNIVNNNGTVYIVYNSGEWVTYRINVLEEGTYTVSTLYSNYTENGNTSMSVSVDEINVLSECDIPSLTSWNEWGECDLGSITLTKGLHEITFKVERGGFHMRNFMLNKRSDSL